MCLNEIKLLPETHLILTAARNVILDKQTMYFFNTTLKIQS